MDKDEPVKSLLDAVSGAIDSADTLPVPAKQEPVTNEDADADVDADDSESGGTSADGASAEADLDASAGTGEVADGKAAGADGKPGAKAKGEGAAGDTGEKAGAKPAPTAEEIAAEAAKKAAAKPLDPVNDPIPPTVSERTRERITSLVGTVKSQAARLEQSDTMLDAISDTGMEPDELAMMLGYARAKHRGTPEQKKQAYTFLKEELRSIALELGETDSVDFLADHQDLKDAVAANQITEAFAKETALLRSRAKAAETTSTATAATTAQRTAHAAGTTALNSVGAQLHKRDGAAVFGAKHKILMAAIGPKRDAAGNITNPGMLSRYSPDQWAQAYQSAYENLPAPVVATPAAPAAAKPQPLRSSTPAGGGGARTPKSLRDAIDSAIDGVDD